MRAILAAAILALCAVEAPAEAQQTAKVVKIGFVAPQGRSLPLFDAFQKGLADLGYVEGKNLVIEPRFAEGDYQRFPQIFAELVGLKVDLLAVTGAITARAAKKAAGDIPIVFSIVVDPVADNVVPSFERPGERITGVTSFDPRQATKQFELLKELIPGLKRIAILGDQGVSDALMKASEQQARALGIQPQPPRLSGPTPDLEAAFAVIAYGTSQTEAIRRMAGYIDKILKGAKPSNLPVEAVTRYELFVNLKTAKQIGISVPASLLERANRVLR